MPGTLFVVATPIGNLEDITARALRVLRSVNVIAAEDTRRTAHLLARYGITTATTSLHEHNESRKTASLIGRLTAGESVALVSDAGTPVVSDPGRQLVREAIRAGVKVEPIPGPSAVMSALAASGFAGDAFAFLGFPPTRASDRDEWFGRLRSIGGIVVFFEAPHRIQDTLVQLQQAVGNKSVSVWREMTKIHEELVVGHISEVVERLGKPIGELTVVIDVGLPTEIAAVAPVLEPQIIDEFVEMTKTERVSRRSAVSRLARRHGKRPNDVYKILERAKKSVD
jgi:16S rRNA (cytidine1402-2'-O)-methyltransferase